MYTKFEIVFSAFGRLFTIWGNAPERPVSEPDVQIAQQLLEDEGYLFVPVEYLDEPYTGSNAFRDRIPDWWHQFFAHV